MKRPASILDGFFTGDADAVEASLRALVDESQPDRSYGVVKTVDDLFSEKIFGNHDLRLWRFAHVAIPPTKHPLAREIVVDKVPLPPPGDRPPTSPLTPAQKLDWIGPINELWRNLVRRSNRIARMKQIRAPQIVIDFDTEALVDDLAHVVAATNAAPLIDSRAWWAHSETEPVTLGMPPSASQDVDAAEILFLDDDTILVQRGRSREILAVSLDGDVRFRFPSPLRSMRSVHGSRVVFDGWLDALSLLDDDADVNPTPFAIYDVADPTWLDTWPDEIACMQLDVDQDGVVHLVDLKTGEALLLPGEAAAWSNDARYLWLTDSFIFDTATGIPQLETKGDAPAAFGLTADFEWRTYHGEVDAAAFASDCRHCAALRGDLVTVLDERFAEVRSFRLPR